MEKETSCINSRAILNYLKTHNIDYTGMLKDLDPEIDSLKDPENFLRDPDNWISSRVVCRLFERATWLLSDDHAAYKIGRYATENNELGFFQRIVLKAFWSVRTGLGHLQKMNDKWNRSKKVELVELKKNNATVRLYWNARMETSKHICQYNQAVYTFMPLTWGGIPIKFKENCCYFTGAPYCEYHLKWPLRSRFLEIISHFFTSKSILADTISEMEKDKEIIERKNDELRAINNELHKRMAERRQTEESLRKSEERLKKFMDSATDGFILFDSNLNYLEVNKSALEITGFKREEIIGKNIIDTFPNIKETGQYAEYKKVIETGSPVLIPDMTSNPLTGNKHIDFKAFKVGDGLGIIFTDITHRKNLEAQLQQSQKIESIGTLAGGIAHDFNNILTPIMAYSEMLIGEAPDDSPLQYGLKQIFRAGERARDVVKQILAFGRQKQEARIPLRLDSILQEVLRLIRSSIPSTVDIRYTNKTETDTIVAESTLIHQVILNLCTNASHAMREEGGVLELIIDELDLNSETSATFDDLLPGEYLRLTVRDTGHGIAPDIIDKIFDPYFTTKGIGEGSGMGLAVTHGIVKSHGGDIRVKSELGKGTTFDVLLPKSTKDITPVKEYKTELPGGTEQILFVDDEETSVEIIEKMMEKLGYKVTSRTSSIEALKVFRDNPEGFDLVITDMTMPDMTGKGLAKELMAIRPEIPVILLTGFSEQMDEYSAKKMGIKAYLMKPVVMKDLAKEIRGVLDES